MPAARGTNPPGARILGWALLTFLIACARSGPPDAAPEAQQAPTVRAGCATDQVRVSNEVVDVCIDIYEAPGFGSPPARFEFEEASAFCAENRRRLCTEQEWEAACRGPQGRLYPYGDEFDPIACVVSSQQPGSVGNSNSCRSGFGAYDMSGNAAEWVDGPLLKGGDFSSDPFGARCGARARAASAADTLSGVRCCGVPTQ